MAKATWRAEAQIISIVDGDTIRASVDLGWRISLTTTLRVAGINTPELPTREGLNAKSYLERLLPAGQIVTILSHRLDKYGRCEAAITLPDGRDLGNILVLAKQAVPMSGYSKYSDEEAQPEMRPRLGFDITAPPGG
jgi:endonuclease YncB( thermonuclease family)